MGTEWSSQHWVILNATCSESIIKAASTFISSAKSWFLPVLAKPLSVLKVHLVCPRALRDSPWVAWWHCEGLTWGWERETPKWCFLLKEFQQNKPGFSRTKHLYQLLLPTVSCCSVAPACSLSFSMEKNLFCFFFKKSSLNPEALQISQEAPCLLPQWSHFYLSHCKTLQQHLLLEKSNSGQN